MRAGEKKEEELAVGGGVDDGIEVAVGEVGQVVRLRWQVAGSYVRISGDWGGCEFVSCELEEFVFEILDFFGGGIEEFESEFVCLSVGVEEIACGREERDRVRGRGEGEREERLFWIDLVVGREEERSIGIVFRRMRWRVEEKTELRERWRS